MTRTVEIAGSTYPALWEICSCCRGEGKSSAYLGAYTADEFHEAFTPDEQEEYFNGAYDRACDSCDGQGKVLVPDNDRLTDAQKAELDEHYEFERMCAAERRAEMRMMGDWG